ncbi:hypothetical protein OBBRIDRAFT_746651, partial [Obba rivulosa]
MIKQLLKKVKAPLTRRKRAVQQPEPQSYPTPSAVGGAAASLLPPRDANQRPETHSHPASSSISGAVAPLLPPPQTQAPSSSEFDELIAAALKEYKQQTCADLDTHPLATKLEECHTVDDVVAIVHDEGHAFEASQKGALMRHLKPIVSILLSVNETLGEGVSLAFPPGKAVFCGIGVLLSTIKNVGESYDALIDLFERIGNFLDLLKIYTQIPRCAEANRIVVQTLASVITILALAAKEVKRGPLTKYGKRLLGERDIEDALKKLDKFTTENARMIEIQSLKEIHRIFDTMKSVMEDGKTAADKIISQGADTQAMMKGIEGDISKIMDDETHDKIRKWLSPPSASTNHNAACNAHYEGSAKWLIQSDTFKKWKTSKSLLWIYGNPGSGKSILCSAIIEDVEDLCKTQGSSVSAYFYCDFRDTAKRNVRGIRSSLLWDLSAQSNVCAKILASLYSKCNRGSREPSDAALAESLKDVLMVLAQNAVFIVIDALDECPASSGTRQKVLELVAEITGLSLANIHVCVTSRPEPDLQRFLEPLAHQKVNVDKESGQMEDIAYYVRSVMDSDPSFRQWRDQDKTLAIDTLSQKAGGMFRWVFCQLETLRPCILSDTIRQTLSDLPETLDETYKRTLMDIAKPNRKYAHRIFQCLTVSVRPLRVEEVAEVLAVDFNSGPIPHLEVQQRRTNPKDDILSLCSTLVTVDANTRVVQFAHFSVQEYLKSDRLASEPNDNVARFRILDEPAYTVIAQACLGVLLQTHNDSVLPSPLEWYAAEHWVNHAQFKTVSSHIEDAMCHLFHPTEPHFAAWIQIHNIDTLSLPVNQQSASPMYYAALCGFLSLMGHLLITHGQDVNASGGYHGTPLQAASSNDHLEVVQFLVEHGANVNALDGHY